MFNPPKYWVYYIYSTLKYYIFIHCITQQVHLYVIHYLSCLSKTKVSSKNQMTSTAFSTPSEIQLAVAVLNPDTYISTVLLLMSDAHVNHPR